MNRIRSVVVLLVVTIAVAAAAYHFSNRSSSVPRSGELVFPGLLERLNDVQRIRITNSDGAFTVERRDGGWVVAEKHGYPADGNAVHQMLVGAAGLTRVEPKTSRPERYSKIGVEEPGAEGSASARFVFESAEPIVSLVVGNRRPSKGDIERTEFYVRTGDDPQAWLVEGSLPSATKQREWLDLDVSSVERARARDAVLTHPDGEVIRVFKNHPGDEDFTLEGLPEGYEIDGIWRVNDIGRMLAQFKFEDVKPADEIKLDGPARTLVIQTFDGIKVDIRIVEVDEKPYAALSAEFDPDLVQSFDAAEATDRQKEALGKLLSAEDAEKQAGALNARWSKWVYQLQDYKYDYVTKGKADIIKKSEADASTATEPQMGPLPQPSTTN